MILTLWTPGASIPVLRKLPYGARNRYTGFAQISLRRQKPVYRVCINFQTAPETGIPGLFFNVYGHLNSRVTEIQTRQQLKKIIISMKHSEYLCTNFAFGHLAANVRVRSSDFSK